MCIKKLILTETPDRGEGEILFLLTDGKISFKIVNKKKDSGQFSLEYRFQHEEYLFIHKLLKAYLEDRENLKEILKQGSISEDEAIKFGFVLYFSKNDTFKDLFIVSQEADGILSPIHNKKLIGVLLTKLNA